jgi:GT2 family glycosyltransferase
VMRGRGNWWWAGSLQQGIEWLNTNAGSMNTVVLFINDDVKFDTDFLERGLSALRAEPNTWICAQIHSQHTGEMLNEGQIYDPSTLTFRKPLPGEPINCASTNGLMVTMESLRKVGGFLPRVLPHYLSDYEFTIRAKRTGIELKCIPAFHLRWDEKTTGLRTFDNHSFWSFVRNYFSKKSAVNPVYWTTFVFLTCRRSTIPWHVFRIWRSACNQILRHAFRRARRQASE